MPRLFLSVLVCAFFLLTTSACRPGSGKRESQALTPSDSLSRRIAAKIPAETLTKIWEAVAPKEGMAFPQTVRFGPDSSIYIADVERQKIYIFTDSGKYKGEIASPDFKYPYLAGFTGDTLAVLNRGMNRLEFYKNGVKVRAISVPEAPMGYVAFKGRDMYFKASGHDGYEGYLTKLDKHGKAIAPTAKFTEAFWRYAGNLRAWEDNKVVSLSGLRPVVDILYPSGKLVAMQLRGFDSPMLPRTRLFYTGEEHELPVLSPSAAPVDSSLFVMNPRPGYLRIDRYNRAGMILQAAEEKGLRFDQNFYPTEMDARRLPDGTVEFAVLFKNPRPSLRLYRWKLGS